MRETNISDRQGRTNIFTHEGGTNIFRREGGGQTFLHKRGRQTFSVGSDGGNYDVDGEEETEDVRIFRGP